MKSQTLPSFWKLYYQLPAQTQRRAVQAYRMWLQDPASRGLRFKRVSRTRPVYSIRISDSCRAVGLLQNDIVTWFWIGSHDDYERLLKRI